MKIDLKVPPHLRRRTIGCHDPIPDALACRLVRHYAPIGITSPFAIFFWTGQVLPGTALRAANLRTPALRPETCSRGLRDPNAVEAELRALEWYLCRHSGQAPQALWREQQHSNLALEESRLVIPWCWREPVV